jgi:ribosome-binding factor A
MSVRIQKVESLIKEEISLIFLHKVQDKNLGLLTITNVKLSPDLKIAKIYFSAFEKEKREEILNKINELKGFIRSELASKIRNLRFIPELQFYDTVDYVEKIESIFKKIHNDRQKDEDA